MLQKRREAASWGFLQEVVHRELGRRGMVVKEVFHEPWREGEVGDGGVFDGKDGGIFMRRKE